MRKIAVTGAAGNIAYSLLFHIASGGLFGKNEPVFLHLLETKDALKALEGVCMELEDCAFPLLAGIKMGDDPYQVFAGVTHAFLVGAMPRSPGMERKDLLAANGKIFIEQGKALNEVADRNVKVLVVGNPCNTNCLIALQNAPSLSKNNFHAMTRLDQNRAQALLAKKAKVSVSDVSKVTIWGNHSTTQVPDFLNARIKGEPVTGLIQDKTWLETAFMSQVQKRGAQVLEARGKSSAASAAYAALEAMKDLTQETPKGSWYSSGIYAKGNPYGIEQDLVYSFPCRTLADGKVEIIEGLQLDSFLKGKLKASETELIEEREAAHVGSAI